VSIYEALLKAATTITRDNREEWLARRKTTIGGSEAASVVGIGYDAPIDLWQEKLGLRPPKEVNEAMRLGTLLEPVIAGEYRRITGVDLAEQLFLTHPDIPWMTCTLDGLREDGIIAQFKTAGTHMADKWGEPGTDDIPEMFLVQEHHEMEVVRALSGGQAGHTAHVLVLVGGQKFMGPYVIQRNDDLVHAIVTRESEFNKCIVSRTPPDWGKMDARALAILFPCCEGEIEISATVAGWVEEYEAAKASTKMIEERAEELKVAILQAMGNAQTGRLPDGRVLKHYVEEVPERMPTKPISGFVKNYFRVLKSKGGFR
jgi:putative phage-type endonuclease